MAAAAPPRPGPPPLTDPDRLRKIVGLAGLEVERSTRWSARSTTRTTTRSSVELLVSGIGLHAARRAGPAAVRAAVLERRRPSARPTAATGCTTWSAWSSRGRRP